MALQTVIKFIALSTIYHYVYVSSYLVVERLSSCSKNNLTKHFVNIATENGKQYINSDMTLNHPLDETVGVTAVIETILDGKNYIPLCNMRENNFCKACNRFLGEMWYDFQRASQIIPGACPIIAKRYYVHHFLLDFDKITLQILPPIGKIRTIINAIDNKNNSLFCVLIVCQNV